MTEKNTASELSRYLAIIKERRYLALSVGLTVMSLIVCIGFLLPKTYKADSTVFVQRGMLAQPFVRNSGIGATLNDELMMLTNYIKSRSILKDVIGKLNMDVMAKTPRQYEALIKNVRKNLHVSVNSGGNGIDLFTISYVNPNPKEARDFVNALVNEYIERTIAERRKAAFGAYDFLKSQIAQYAKKLDESSQQLTKFQQTHLNAALGAGGAPALGMYDLQTRQVDAEIRIGQLLDKRKALKMELSGKKAPASALVAQEDPLQARLNALYRKLAALKTQYTDQYPAVVNLKAQIDSLRRQLQSGSAGGASPDAARQRIEEELAQTNSSIGLAKARLAETSELAQAANRSLGGLPTEQNQMKTLQNTQTVNQGIYDSLVRQLESANVSKNLEASDYSSMLRVVDPAVMPYVPYTPDRVKVILIGLFMGLASGAGSAIGADFLTDAYRDEDALEKDLKIPVLASVPRINEEGEDRKSRRRDLAIFGTAGVYVLIVLALLANEALYRYRGIRILPF